MLVSKETYHSDSSWIRTYNQLSKSFAVSGRQWQNCRICPSLFNFAMEDILVNGRTEPLQRNSMSMIPPRRVTAHRKFSTFWIASKQFALRTIKPHRNFPKTAGEPVRATHSNRWSVRNISGAWLQPAAVLTKRSHHITSRAATARTTLASWGQLWRCHDNSSVPVKTSSEQRWRASSTETHHLCQVKGILYTDGNSTVSALPH